MTETTAPDIQSLRALLVDVDTPPLEHAFELRRLREQLVDDPMELLDLDRLELRFLERQAQRRDVSAGLRRSVRRARVEALDRTVLRIKAGFVDVVPAIFDLAELKAAYLHEGCEDEATALDDVLHERIAEVSLGDKLEEEARERYAAIVTEEEDLGIDHRIHLLRETGAVMQALFDRGQTKIYRRLARRLVRAAGDRGLYKRLEDLLTRRGVVLLETTSLLLLLVVFVLVTVELSMDVTPAVLDSLHLADAIICSFFIGEFLFKLALAPSRLSWFYRNVVTDLLPAIPAVVLFFNPSAIGAGATSAASVRMVRLIRIGAFARYMQALRPILGFFRLLLFLVRGLDSLVARFSPLINRNFIFFESGTQRAEGLNPDDPRRIVFQAIRREHVLLDDLSPAAAETAIVQRADDLAHRLETREIAHTNFATPAAETREVPVEEAIERLYTVRPDELSMTMSRTDLMALDRVSRVINAPLIRSLPFIRWFKSKDPGDTPEARVVSLGRRIADQLEGWRGRILFFADLHGIVTGPQVLDRVATAMVKASQRPAVRLLMFGVLFWLVRMFVDEESPLNELLGRFVATPLVVLGGVCFVVLFIGRWLKWLAGEATENLKRTSEAHFINLLELVKSRTRDNDLVFLARRVFRFEMDAWEAALALGQQVAEASSVQVDIGSEEELKKVPPEAVREDLTRVAFLYMHFLDGAILHESDIKTTEQLLANLSLENIRRHHLKFSRRDRKRVRRLSLASGSIFTGPFLWFRFITESVSLETAKRIIEYNRHCLTLQQRKVASDEDIADMKAWLAKRWSLIEGRIIEKLDPPDSGAIYRTTEFNSMDFLAVSERRDAQIERVFGEEVLALLQADRRSMIREIFGTRPLHKLPRSRRTVNFYRFFLDRLSRGRVLLAPIFFLGAIWWMLKNIVGQTIIIVREILRPESVSERRESGRAPFRVALRKIHRMKAPGLLEAMEMRVAFDPAYCGAPPTWSFGMKMEEMTELERDMDFLQMRERHRVVMRGIAEENIRRVAQLHGLVRDLDIFDDLDRTDGTAADEEEMQRKLGERAVTVAYITDRENLRSLFQAKWWLDRELPRHESPTMRIKGSMTLSFLAMVRRRFRAHPVDRLLRGRLAHHKISRRGRRNFKRAWLRNIGPTRQIVGAWLQLPDDVAPRERALELAVKIFRSSGEVSRELAALRAVQSLSVLDVRNYRSLVFKLGGYADDGEDPAVAQALP